MHVSALEAIRHYEKNQRDGLLLLDSYEELQSRIKQALATVRAQEEQARATLAESYLPELSQAGIKRAEKLTGFRGFSRRNPLEALAHETAVLQKRVTSIEIHPSYQQREALIGAGGTLTAKLRECEDMLQPWAEECWKYEQHEHFLQLVELGYDTPRYAVSWLEPKYWRYWAAGDRITEALGMDDFGDDVLPAWREVSGKRDAWVAQVHAAEAEVQVVRDLVQEHDQALTRLPRLPSLFLDQCRTFLAEYLEQADLSLLEQWLHADAPDDRALTMSLRRTAGLRAKVEFFEELLFSGIGEFVTALRRRIEKFSRKSTKYARSKYVGSQLPASVLDTGFQDKLPKYRARVDKVGRLVDRIARYDGYGRFDLQNQPELWWVEMTGKAPNSLTPKLRRWYDRHPALRPEHDRRWDEAADAVETLAEAARTLSRHDADEGYLS